VSSALPVRRRHETALGSCRSSAAVLHRRMLGRVRRPARGPAGLSTKASRNRLMSDPMMTNTTTLAVQILVPTRAVQPHVELPSGRCSTVIPVD